MPHYRITCSFFDDSIEVFNVFGRNANNAKKWVGRNFTGIKEIKAKRVKPKKSKST